MNRLSHAEIRSLLRSKGLCGRVYLDRGQPIDQEVACVLAPGHDGGVHDRDWSVTKHVVDSPYARDSRESTAVWRVSNSSGMVFEAIHEVDAEWLVRVLNSAEVAP